VRRGALIELDEFVDFGAIEPVAISDQALEAIPTVAVCEHKRVDVHRTETSRPAERSGSPQTRGSVRSMSEVVTGDAVVLDVRVAQLPVRAVSALIDIAVIAIGYLISLMLWAGTLGRFDDAAGAAIMAIFTVLLFVGYPLVLETATRGRTVGKMVMGLRVVSDDGGPERFRQALFRALASIVELWMLLGSPAVICSMLSPRAKRIGDIFAGTIVISERGPKLGPPPMMPPQLAWWASSLQLSGLSAEQADVARQFLSRAMQLDPQLREQMAYRIATDVLSRVGPPPPPGTPPQLALAAVLAERHRRELARLRPYPYR